MRGRIQLTVLTIVALLALAAIGEPEHNAPYKQGIVHRSCAPWDGDAVALTLSANPLECGKSVEGPRLYLAVWRNLPLHSGQVVKFSASSDQGSASRCIKGDDCEPAEWGEIVFDSYKERTGATGSYVLRFKNGETVHGRFDAKWCESHELCG